MAEDNNQNNADDGFVYNKEEIDAAIAKFREDKNGKKKKEKNNNYYDDDDNSGKKKSGGKIFFIIFCVLVAVAVVGVCLYFFVFKKDDDSQQGQYNIQTNNASLGDVTTIESEGGNYVTATAHAKNNAIFLGWAKGDLYGNTVISEEPTLTIELDDQSQYYALFNLTVDDYTYRDITYTLYNEAYLATATGVTTFTSQTLEIPSIVNASYQVYKIANNAFQNLDITALRLSDKIIEIGEGAFANCSGLSSVYVSSNNKNYSSGEGNAIIDTNTNSISVGTTSTTIPENAVNIDDYAYAGRAITEITIPNSIQTIGESAFEGCSTLERVNFDAEQSNLTMIGQSAFANCNNLTFINLPNSLTSIESYAFDGCALAHISNVENTSLTTIGKYAFRDCLVSSVTFPNTLNSIGDYAFYNAGLSMMSVRIPNSVTILGKEIFYNSSFSEIYLDANVTTLPENTFYSCNVSTLTLPTTLETIEARAFYDCTRLETINLGELENLVSIGDEAFYNTGSEQYKFDLVLPKNLSTFGNNVFGNSYVKSVDFSNNTAIIIVNNNLFKDCQALESVVLNNVITIIGTSAFENCTSLSIVDFGQENTSLSLISENAFKNCISLSAIDFSNLSALYTIGNYAFYNCDNLTNIEFNSYLGQIDDYAFSESGLTQLTFPTDSNLINIGEYAFASANITGEIVLPAKVKEIGTYAFANNKITSVTLESEVASVIDFSFKDNAIATITTKVKNPSTISLLAFDFTDTMLIYVPENYIENYKSQFSSYSDRIVTYNDKTFYITAIGNYAFSDLGSKSMLTLPSTVTYIGKNILSGTTMNNIIVDANNTVYRSENSVIYEKATGNVVLLGNENN